jgi:hypothetical protein
MPLERVPGAYAALAGAGEFLRIVLAAGAGAGAGTGAAAAIAPIWLKPAEVLGALVAHRPRIGPLRWPACGNPSVIAVRTV